MKKLLLLFLCLLPLFVKAQPIQSCVDIFNMRQYWNSNPNPTLYTLENNPVVSFISVIPNGYRVYIQDISGGIIMLLPPELPPFMNIGDLLGDLKGSLTLYEGSLAFIPAAKPIIVSSDNPVYPQNIDVMTMMLNPGNYESMLIQLSNITMNGGGDLFETGKHYIIYQQKATTALFTLFPYADYIGTPIPDAPVNIAGLVTFNRFTGEVTITPRFMADISYSYGNNPKGSWNADDVFASDGYLQVRSLTRQPIQVYTLLGQIIIQEWIEPGFTELYVPTNGVYIVKLGKLTKRISIP
ncbi:MAG: hypothetical protein RSE51_02095 [Bacteroidales bacterium]